jgi:O-antigen/teichoic acid export membrane protein
MQSALLFTTLVIAVGLLVLLPLVFVLPLRSWLQIEVTGNRTTQVVAALMLGQFLSFIPLGLMTGIYRSIGEYARGATIGNVQRFTQYALVAVVLSQGGGMVALAGSQLLAPFVFGFLFVMWDLRRRHPEIELNFQWASARLALSFLAPSWLFLLIQLSASFIIQGSTLLAGVALGAAAVPVFVTLRTLSNIIRQGVGTLYHASWPELTSLEARGEYGRLAQVHLFMAKGVVSVSMGAAVLLYFAGPDIVRAWTGGRVAYDAVLMQAFLVLVLSQAWWMTSSLVLISSNNHRGLALVQIAAGGAGLMLGWGLSSNWGLAGIVYGLALPDILLCGLWVPASACRLVGQPVWSFIVEVLGRGTLPAAAVTSSAAAFQWIVPFEWGMGRWALLGLVVGLVCAVSTYVVWLNERERGQVVALLRSRGVLAGGA